MAGAESMPKSGAMKTSWKVGLVLALIVLLLSGAGLLWLVQKRRDDGKVVAESANARHIRAEQGDPKAEAELAFMYSHGQGVPQDLNEALRLRRKSAEQGYAAGEIGLAYMYLHGQVVQEDDNEALGWYRKAAGTGDAYAENNLGILYDEGELLPQDYAEALRWYRKAVDQNYPAAEYNLGNMYYYGHAVSRDVPEAFRWYRKAAFQGNTYSQRILGLRGRGLSSIYATALSICAFGSLLLLAGQLFPRNNSWNRSSRSTTAVGLLGLTCVGLDAYAHSQFSVFPSEIFANSFTFARHVLTGIFFFLLLSVVTPMTIRKRVRVLLGILSVALVSFNVWEIAFVSAHQVVLSSPAVARLFSIANGLMIGMAIPLVVSLQRNRAAGTPGPNDDGFKDANEAG